MTRNTRIALIAVVAALLLSVCSACKSVSTNAGRVADVAATIADFDLPAGYEAESTVTIAGYRFVSYAPGDGHSHIQFIQGPKNGKVNEETLLKYAGQASSGSSWRGRVHTTAGRQGTICGQQVTIVTGEGTNHDGDPYRTVTAVFQGKGGPTLLSVESPVASWDQAMVDAFIASIR